ncbi:NADH-FMN oxidoreductase RutF, flavin reductase (DIM6/NTAB) family [Rhizobium sp. RU20A]|uniref:flavin reductase family protein n=1 Tax=Rhizobium sp. RU20A TaxID=1907412 RepID=UPI000957455F|nr:flavin reductase family protein [Rhizobium sp. RU20A]SIQ11396.1 NADH-FMN oxidoreductase RutF, flavin reductase (DIM6/NTAB) family [Rhizobium sp. RU20A]
MFYETKDNHHGLAHDPFKAIVSPRPIGWIGTLSKDGVRNLAPYSFFNAISDRPKLVMFSSSGWKDSVENVKETGVFTASFVGRAIVDAMNATSAPVGPEVDEFALAGLTPEPGRLVNAPFVAEALAVLECRATDILQPKGLDGAPSDNFMVIAEVVAIHIRDEAIRDGRFDMGFARPVGRLGYMDYADAGDVFELRRPGGR